MREEVWEGAVISLGVIAIILCLAAVWYFI